MPDDSSPAGIVRQNVVQTLAPSVSAASSSTFPSYVAAMTLAGELERIAVQAGADAVLAASVFHFGDFTVRAAKEHMRARGIEVRL